MEYKKFLWDNQYEFGFDGSYTLAGMTVSQGENSLLSIQIDGKNYLLDRKWLGLVTHYEIDLPFDEVLKIRFFDCESKVIGLKCKSLMVVWPPVETSDGFRLVPGFPRYVINDQGVVISRKRGNVLEESIGPYGYPYVNVYDPDKGKWRSVSTHILLARAFIHNRDPSYRYFVNHKNGKKLDYSLRNLEWTTSRENVQHAVKSGLRNDNRPCRVRDILTGEIKHHPSIGCALLEIGLASRSKPLTRCVGKNEIPILFKNRYEIKLTSDASDWYYLTPVASKGIRLKPPYQAKNLKTGEVIESDSMKSLIRETGISEERILKVLKSFSPMSCQDFTFRMKCDDNWSTTYEPVVFHPPRKVKVTDLNTFEVFEFESLRQVRSRFLIDKRTLVNKLRSKQPHRGLMFEEMINNSPTGQ